MSSINKKYNCIKDLSIEANGNKMTIFKYLLEAYIIYTYIHIIFKCYSFILIACSIAVAFVVSTLHMHGIANVHSLIRVNYLLSNF